jgi:hypothetical protein
MRSAAFVMTAALTATITAPAAAQTPTYPYTYGEEARTTSIVSGFIGSNFGTNTSNLDLDGGASLDFGVQAAYLWRGIVGGEFIADFAPNVGNARTVLEIANEPDLNSYMFNAIGVYPFGARGRYQPYMSGGVGAIQLRADLFDIAGNQFSSSESRFGGNVGAGLMVFGEYVGVRGDIRYYRATSSNDLGALVPDNRFNEVVLSGLRFWRGNIGVAFRW